MVLLFERYSLWSLALAFGAVRQADRVLFYHPSPLGEIPPPDWKQRAVTRAIRIVNPFAQVDQVDQQGLYELGFYQSNFESDRDVERMFQRLSESAGFQAMLDVIGDRHIENFYKMRLVDRVRSSAAFARAALHVLGPERGGAAVPSPSAGSGLAAALSPADYARIVPLPVRAGHRLRELALRTLTVLTLWNLLLLACLPFVHLMVLLGRRGVASKPDPIRADVVMPLMCGFWRDGLVRGRKRYDDSYLVGKGLEYDRLLFYFSDWAFSPEERHEQERFMREQGIRYCDPRRFRPGVGYVREAAALGLHLWAGLFRRPSVVWDDPRFALLSAALLSHWLKELLFVRTVDFKVAVEYQDYLAHHVLRTVLAQREGRLTVGVHHNEPDGPYMLPAIRYTYVSRHCLWGEEFRRMHAPYWESLPARPIGAPRADYVVAAQQPPRRQELDAIYEARYEGRRPLIVLLFPGLSSLNVPGRIVEMLEGLRRLKSLPGTFQVVCRFRAVAHLEAFRRKGLDAIMAADDRIVADLADLTTYEWFALSDVVVVNSASTGMIEAAAAGKPCFSFDFQMIAEIVYRRYGSDLVLKTAEDLVRVVRHCASGFQGWNCQWDQLAKDYSYFSDGKNLDRFRSVILDAVEEAAGKGTKEDRLR